MIPRELWIKNSIWKIWHLQYFLGLEVRYSFDCYNFFPGWSILKMLFNILDSLITRWLVHAWTQLRTPCFWRNSVDDPTRSWQVVAVLFILQSVVLILLMLFTMWANLSLIPHKCIGVVFSIFFIISSQLWTELSCSPLSLGCLLFYFGRKCKWQALYYRVLHLSWLLPPFL